MRAALRLVPRVGFAGSRGVCWCEAGRALLSSASSSLLWFASVDYPLPSFGGTGLFACCAVRRVVQCSICIVSMRDAVVVCWRCECAGSSCWRRSGASPSALCPALPHFATEPVSGAVQAFSHHSFDTIQSIYQLSSTDIAPLYNQSPARRRQATRQTRRDCANVSLSSLLAAVFGFQS